MLLPSYFFHTPAAVLYHSVPSISLMFRLREKVDVNTAYRIKLLIPIAGEKQGLRALGRNLQLGFVELIQYDAKDFFFFQVILLCFS